MRKREGEQKERVRHPLVSTLGEGTTLAETGSSPGRSWGFILVGFRVRHYDKWDIRGHSRRGQALQRGPSKRP